LQIQGSNGVSACGVILHCSIAKNSICHTKNLAYTTNNANSCFRTGIRGYSLISRYFKKTLLEKAFTEKCFAASQSVGHGWEVVEKYISGQKCHEKIDTVPVIAEEKEKLRTHKTWYTSHYDKLFGWTHQK
jgi:hypothetical protein